MGIMWDTIIEKLGFDPRIPAEIKVGDSWAIDDNVVNPYSKLNSEEKEFLMVNCFGVIG